MSIIALSSDEPTCTIDDLKAICNTNNFSIEPGSTNESAFLLFANSFDAVCHEVQTLPEYEDPRLRPIPVKGGKRSFDTPTSKDNPLNGWAHKATLEAISPTSSTLVGKTVVFKDNVSVGGLPLGLGCSPKHFKDGEHPISSIDATVVSRVLAAGGMVKGTATCENFSAFALSLTSASGVVHNAWLPGYATGGSSSGCAALVSIGDVEQARKDAKDNRDYALGAGVDLAIGGDQGGSIRLPACYSGIFGLKPTHGLVPYTGIAPLCPMIDHTGPMARTVEDIALLLGVLAGYDGIDPRMSPESPMPSQVPHYLEDLNTWVAQKKADDEWTTEAAAKGLRIGVLRESFEVAGLDPNVAATVRNAANRFISLGAEVKNVSIPMHAHGAAIWTIATRSAMPHFIANKPSDQLGHTMPGLDPLPVDQTFFDILSNRNPAVVNLLMNATRLEQKYGPALVRKAHMHVHELRAAYDKAFEEIDVLLTPVTPTVAPPIPRSALKSETNPNGHSESIMDLCEPAIGNTLNTSPFNITGHPAMSMPVGRGKVMGREERLPIGMQVVARRFDEGSIFRAAKAWEVGGHWMES